MTLDSKGRLVVAFFLFGVNGIPSATMADTGPAARVDISADWTSHITWHQSQSDADEWAPSAGVGTWVAFSEFHSPKYDPKQIPLVLRVARDPSFAGRDLFAQPLRYSREVLPIELVEAAAVDIPSVQLSGNYGRDRIQPLQLFGFGPDGAEKLRGQKGQLRFELQGVVGSFTRKAKIALDGPLKIDLSDQSIELQISEGASANAVLPVARWPKHHVVIIKTIVPAFSGDRLRNSIRCYFLVDLESKRGGLLGIARYDNDSSPLAKPSDLGPGLTGDYRVFNVPEQISLKNKELYIYEFDSEHPFDVILTDPNFVMDIPPDPSK